ncbi:hypothetical protein SISNIDRAFT_486110 [Sistotremastrum niveocremeum HHB9708]|uniref:Uncharacterized protein n=2 Tax=Sistotremastraceae TaxID=3402574 RepID=A0A164UFX5_9AGAM|nr:hypothetical protein SISNIDRAFT_486110 [Sistotremastrum niveocremeum HHB9708]KZT42618.1 hypothetical protein SISSUDRAFT_1058392 [Sistotremastrum suecicum HHB10207 ss-3]
MVQGSSKGLQKKATSARHSVAQPKKGQRAIPPKKKAAIKHASIQRSLSAKINKSIENQMVAAASAGKLTIMKNSADPQKASKS